MGKKVDLNAPRETSQDHKKSMNSHSHRTPFLSNNINRQNNNNQPLNDEVNDNNSTLNNQSSTSNGSKSANFGEKIAKKALQSKGVPEGLAEKGIALADKFKGSIKMPVIIHLAITAMMIIIPIITFLLTFSWLISIIGSDNNSSSSGSSKIGLRGYPYYGDSSVVCKSVEADGNLLPMEEYIAGVISVEVSGFPDESLKAFAVLARTYIINHKRVGDDPDSCYYQIASSDKTQAHRNNPDERYLKAAEETRGLIITMDGNPTGGNYDASCVYTASQAKALEPTKDFNDDNYYIRYGELTIGGNNFQEIPKDIAKTFGGTLQTYINFAESGNPCYQNHGYGMSQNGSLYLERIKNYTWEEIIDFYHQGKHQIMSIYHGYGNTEYSGEYPIEPDNELYSNLEFLVNESFTDFLQHNNSTVEEYDAFIKEMIENAGVGTRNGVITAGVGLIGSLAEMGYKLNYQWGGKYTNLGTNKIWGTPADMDWLCSSASYGIHYDSSYCYKHYKWHSFDCSGFVTWAVINGMQDTKIQQSQLNGAPKIDLSSSEAVCKPGGVLVSSGHIVLVVGIDEDKKKYIVAESTGSDIFSGRGGVKLSYYNFGANGYKCSNLDEIYGD